MNEALCVRLLRIVQNLICQALFDDFSVQHHDGTVCQHPYHGAVYAVVSSVAKIVAAGGDYKKPP